MKKYMLVVALLLSVAGFSAANDACGTVVSTPVQTCPPPAPVCTPAPAACAAPAQAAVSRDPEVYYEVPVTKKVKAQEVYTVNEKRTKVEMEVKTRLTKPNAPRIVRSAKNPNGRPMKVHKDLPREQTYLKPLKTVYEVPVTKTREITIEVEEKTLVPASKMRFR